MQAVRIVMTAALAAKMLAHDSGRAGVMIQ
jgi:hypothetical protein